MKPRTVAALALGAGAAVALVALSSGRRASAPPSAPPAASTTPAAAPDGGRASVAVYDDGTPAGGRWVVFGDRSGAVRASVRSGEDGAASGPASPGSIVTVAYGESVKELVTYVGVDPGDAIVVGEKEDEGGAEGTACTARLSLPTKRPDAARMTLSLGVGAPEVADPARPLSLSVLRRYLKDGKFDALGEAWSDAGAPIAFTHAWIGGCGAGGGSTVDATLPAFATTYRSFSIVATDPPRAPATLVGELAILGAGGDRFERGRREAPIDGGVSMAFRVPPPLGARASAKIAVLFDGTSDRTVLTERRASMPSTLAIDLGERMLPRVSGAVLEHSGPRPTVRWKIEGSPAKADALVVRLAWPKTREHVWTIVAPPDTAPGLEVPELPPDLADWRPGADDLTVSVALVDASFFDGFAAVKKEGLAELSELPDDEGDVVVRYSESGDLDF